MGGEEGKRRGGEGEGERERKGEERVARRDSFGEEG